MESVYNKSDYIFSLTSAQNCSDICNDTDKSLEMMRHSAGWTVVFILAYAVVFIVGFVGNIMVACVINFRPHMKTVTNMFILNLAIADLLVNIFCVIPTLLSNILRPWVLGAFMCTAVTYIQGVSVCASVYSLVAISLDRFLAIWFPMKMPRGLSKSHARIIILCIWILAASIASPWALVFSLNEEDEQIYCVESWSSETASKVYFIIGNLVFCYALPLALVILTNGLIWHHVAQRKVPKESASPAAIKRVHKKTRISVLRMLTVVTLVFLLSWLPLYIIFLVLKIGAPFDFLSETQAEEAIPFAQWLGAFNSSINPLLYAFLNKKFRDAFRSLVPSPRSMSTSQNYHNNHTQQHATGNSLSLNNSTVSINAQSCNIRQKKSTFRFFDRFGILITAARPEPSY